MCFDFGTKAETLNLLRDKLRKSYILDQVTFTVEEFQLEKNKLIKKIRENLKTERVIVRSSSLEEDSKMFSMAGKYKSIIDVDIKNDLILSNSIQAVINSYDQNNKNNQILIQPYLTYITMSGVVLTKHTTMELPYYVINYTEDNDTESITSGYEENDMTFICHRKSAKYIVNKKILSLINAVKEVEKVTNSDSLDIEFAFVNDNIYIFQVRMLITNKKNILLEHDIDEEIINIQKFLKNHQTLNPFLMGKKSAYGVMPDWNPAEIIGINPRKLSSDLYEYIITDNVWAKSRYLLGYKDVCNTPGLVFFSGKPYVDIKMSFNTFLPFGLNNDISTRLVDYFISSLRDSPDKHDKIEFDIAITSYDFNFNDKMIKLRDNDFSQIDIDLLKESYKELTVNIIRQYKINIDLELLKLKKLKEKREKVYFSKINIPSKIMYLLEDCKTYGSLPFANLARLSFIGLSFLKSLLDKKIISEDIYNNFVKSFYTVSKKFTYDCDLYIQKKLSKTFFLNEYGHLRPGTYDITSRTYKEGLESYINVNKNSRLKCCSEYVIPELVLQDIQIEIDNHNLSFSASRLMEFIKNSIESRELAKLEFTKNISLVLDLISELTLKYSISNEDASYLSLGAILKYVNKPTENIKQYLESDIIYNKKINSLSLSLHLPNLIFEDKDIQMFFYSKEKPNFITYEEVIGDSILLFPNVSKGDLDDKIIIIESADPGFDWIFSYNIKGLITKYGGLGSHMSIRCLELNLPAAIGCGEKIFNDLVIFNKIHLNCRLGIVNGL